MAERKLRDGLWTSPRFNSLGSAEAQLLFVKLINIVDDFGCFDGRDSVIITRAFPVGGLHPEEREGFAEMMRDLHRADLIVRYLNNGRPFIAIPRWSHGYRFKRDFPAPPINVDVRDIKLRGKYGKVIDWRNPDGSDDASVLLGLDGEPVKRQPSEWRRVGSDFAPLAVTDKKRSVTVVTKPPVTPVTRAVTEAVTAPVTDAVTTQSLAHDVTSLRSNEDTKVTLPTVDDARSAVTDQTQSLQKPSTATATANGGIHLDPNGAGWTGISEAQRLAWQEMCDNISIPDQLARAAAWLKANARERDQYERDGTVEAFIIRWLLRESRSKAH